jgi:hypothetical protein
MSPLSTLSAVGSGLMGLLQCKIGSNGQIISGSAPITGIMNTLKGFLPNPPNANNPNTGGSTASDINTTGSTASDINNAVTNYENANYGAWDPSLNGGMGGYTNCPSFSTGVAKGGSIKTNYSGCSSTKHRGALPYRKG